MSRERVIVEIENLDQAIRIEETIRTGYCDPIAENLLAWIAVEEDIVDSYGKLSQKFGNQEELKRAMEELTEESRTIINRLQKLLDSVEELGAERDRRHDLLQTLLQKSC